MEVDRTAQFTRGREIQQGNVEFHLLLPIRIEGIHRTTFHDRTGEQWLCAMKQANDDFHLGHHRDCGTDRSVDTHFVEFTSRNQLAREDA